MRRRDDHDDLPSNDGATWQHKPEVPDSAPRGPTLRGLATKLGAIEKAMVAHAEMMKELRAELASVRRLVEAVATGAPPESAR